MSELKNICEELNKLINEINKFFNTEWRDKERYQLFSNLLNERLNKISEKIQGKKEEELNEEWTKYQEKFIKVFEALRNKLTEEDYALITSWQAEEAKKEVRKEEDYTLNTDNEIEVKE